MFDLVGDSDIVDILFDVFQLTVRKHTFYFGQILFFHSIEDFLFIREAWIIHQDFE